MYVLGVDIGSSATKIVAVDLNGNILYQAVENLGTGAVFIEPLLERMYEKAGLTPDGQAYMMATGYGRLTLKNADAQMSEISCHAKGLRHVCPGVRTIIDIGGQDCKAISLDAQGRLDQFVMNEKCAAGTGRFLDTMSRVLNIPISELGAYNKRARSAVPISNTCTVFAESEVVSALSQEENSKEDIVAGICQSVARRVSGLARRVGVVSPVCLTGGGAKNSGVHHWLEEELNVKIQIPPNPQITGALGAALLGLERCPKTHISK